MPDIDSQIFSAALVTFLLLASANLIVEMAITLILLLKKLRSTMQPINIDPEIMSGEPVFNGTRVPIRALMDNLAAGISLDEFLENFPTVKREQATTILKLTAER